MSRPENPQNVWTPCCPEAATTPFGVACIPRRKKAFLTARFLPDVGLVVILLTGCLTITPDGGFCTLFLRSVFFLLLLAGGVRLGQTGVWGREWWFCSGPGGLVFSKWERTASHHIFFGQG
jgi:hypothetical protein